MAFSLMGAGAAMWCPNNNCSNVIKLTENGFTLQMPAGHLVLNAVVYEDGSVSYSWSFWSRRFIQVASPGFLGPNDTYLTGELRQLATLSQAYDKAVVEAKGVAVLEASGVVGLGADVVAGMLEREATALLYRAVSRDELADIMGEPQMFRQGPNSFESGKWFAETPEAAAQWGDWLHGPGNYEIIEVEVPTSTVDQFMRVPRLDGIGPAIYAPLGPLNGAGPVVRPWP